MPPVEEQATSAEVVDAPEEPSVDVASILDEDELVIPGLDTETSDDDGEDDEGPVGPDGREASDDSETEEKSTGSQAALIALVTSQTEMLNDLRQQLKEATGKKQEAEDDFTYDIGDIEDPNERGFEELRPVLNRAGKFYIQQARKVAKIVSSVKSEVEDLRADMQAEMVKIQLQMKSPEEKQFVSWAKKKGFEYKDTDQLIEAIDLFRKVQGDKKNGKKAARANNANPPADTPPNRVSAGKRADELRGDDFARDFARAKKLTIRQLRATA